MGERESARARGDIDRPSITIRLQHHQKPLQWAWQGSSIVPVFGGRGRKKIRNLGDPQSHHESEARGRKGEGGGRMRMNDSRQ